MTVKRWHYRLRFVHPAAFLHELVVFAVTLQRRFAHDAAAFDAPMFLRRRERIFFSDLCHAHALDVLAVRDCEMRIRRRPQKIGVESGVFGDRPGFLPTVPERNRDRILGVAGRNERRNYELASNRLIIRVFRSVGD